MAIGLVDPCAVLGSSGLVVVGAVLVIYMFLSLLMVSIAHGVYLQSRSNALNRKIQQAA